MSTLSTHVLDTTTGLPAAGVVVRLERAESALGLGDVLARDTTDANGRVATLAKPPLEPGIYRLVFEVESYFGSRGIESFYPEIMIRFRIETERHYHVPLLLAPFGYTTYRGS
jgi:5-hydroxyisourate hydrolase